eukprot:6451247-Alexandrium_andersonii.AAC.1
MAACPAPPFQTTVAGMPSSVHGPTATPSIRGNEEPWRARAVRPTAILLGRSPLVACLLYTSDAADDM